MMNSPERNEPPTTGGVAVTHFRSAVPPNALEKNMAGLAGAGRRGKVAPSRSAASSVVGIACAPTGAAIAIITSPRTSMACMVASASDSRDTRRAARRSAATDG
jgi:hypothetical protein